MPTSFQRVGSLFKSLTRPLPGVTRKLGRIDSLSLPMASSPLSVVPTLEAVVVSASSKLYQKASALQAARFARASAPSPNSYLETAHPASEHTIPLVIRRRNSSQADLVAATVSLEMPSARTMESTVEFLPGSQSEQLLARDVSTMIRGFAAPFNPDWQEVVDVLDTIGSALVQIAKQCGIEWLWFVPRRPLMGLLLAEIPGLLPPYRFTLCTDVLRWKLESPLLQELRGLHMKEIPISEDELPTIYQISPAVWEEDVARRLALLRQRKQEPDFPRLLQAAMRQAYQQARMQIELLNKQRNQIGNYQDVQHVGTKAASDRKLRLPAAPPETPAITQISGMTAGQKTGSDGKQGFLPFAASSGFEANYLSQVVERGGAAAHRYKTLSYDLLQIAPGMRILDVGCGIGVDLPALADRVGETGLVVGLDHDLTLLNKAKEVIVGRNNVQIVLAEAQKIPFPDASFDRARTDRVLQHIPESVLVLTEIWRTLRPGGVLTIVEPDWKTIALFPASPAGGDDDHTLSAVLEYNQRKTVHALIGRQLKSLLWQQGSDAWERVDVQAEAFTFSSWKVVDALLQVPRLAQELAKEEPNLADEINAWLQTIEIAAQRREFLASMQLFYARARKVASGT